MSVFPIKNGSAGNEVLQLQKWLNLALEIAGASRERLAEDGKYGPKSAAVVKKYFARDQVTEADYKAAIAATPAMKTRLAEIKASGKNPDNLIQNLIQSEQGVFENLLAIAQSYDNASPQKRQQYASQFSTAYAAGQRLVKRTNALKANGTIKIKTGKPSRLDELAARYVTSGVTGVGLIQFLPLAIPVVSALIIGGGAVKVYDWITPHYRESTTDFKVTKELRAVLDKLTPAEQQVVLQTAEAQVDAAYDEGRRDEKLGGGLFGGAANLLKWGGITLLGGAALYLAWPAIQGGRTAIASKMKR